jgi:hypothetical protein
MVTVKVSILQVAVLYLFYCLDLISITVIIYWIYEGTICMINGVD